MEFTTREQFGGFLNELGLVGEGVEIGSCYGGFASILLATWNGKKLFMIDPMCQQPADVYREPVTNDEARFAVWRPMLEALVKSHGKRAEWVRQTSEDAIKSGRFPNGFFDFIYLDGNHSLEAATYDLENWYPKVKSGGVFALHDNYDATHDGYHCLVKTALERWNRSHNLEIHELKCSSAWMIKP